MTIQSVSEHKFFRPVAGAALSAVCGLLLLFCSWGDSWTRASYDNLFRFGSRAVTNRVVLVLMDNEAYAALGQSRDVPWDRKLHADLLNKLADDGCQLVVMDIFFRTVTNSAVDKALSSAMARLGNVVLAAEQASLAQPGLEAARPALPHDAILAAGKTNWGVAWLDPDQDFIVRRHWPFPSPGPYPSLAWTAAKISGARLDSTPVKRWVRYYNFEKSVTTLSYNVALTKAPGYFRDKVVFIGTEPRTPLPDGERDEFRTPHYNWTSETVGGVEIMATLYLNLMNGDALRRLNWPAEALMLVLIGIVLGAALPLFDRRIALMSGLASALLFMLAAVLLSYFSNYWFPWLIAAGGQVPCAVIWAFVPIKPPPTPISKTPVLKSRAVEPARLDVGEDRDVFISHASGDDEVAKAICAALEAARISCWIASRDVLAGAEYGEAILSAIEECRVMVLIFSRAANESPHIRSEVERAMSKRKYIITFRIENVTPAKALEYNLGNRQWLDAFTPPLKPHIANLVNAVGLRLKDGTPSGNSPAKASPAIGPKNVVAPKLEGPHGTAVLNQAEQPLPDTPEFEIIQPPIGRGSFGTVWIVRNAIGQWQALKAVYASKFGDDSGPYEAEFKGVQRYKPVSEKHAGLLRIDLVSKMKPEGYFYYVMELGDAQSPGWEAQPRLYKPRDLENYRKQAYQRRLPILECLRIITVLADALNFLHRQGLTHRDIKPANVIFVGSFPKLADIGLVANIRPADQIHTLVGTPGYMPPQSEQPGTVQADIYSLGMVLHVISTGCEPGQFSQTGPGCIGKSPDDDFAKLYSVVLRACQADLARRYQSAEEMLRDLQQITKDPSLQH